MKSLWLHMKGDWYLFGIPLLISAIIIPVAFIRPDIIKIFSPVFSSVFSAFTIDRAIKAFSIRRSAVLNNIWDKPQGKAKKENFYAALFILIIFLLVCLGIGISMLIAWNIVTFSS